jgi:hypothetical protein
LRHQDRPICSPATSELDGPRFRQSFYVAIRGVGFCTWRSCCESVPGLEDYVDLELPNALLDDWTDDPDGPDLSKEESAAQLAELETEFEDIFVDELP